MEEAIVAFIPITKITHSVPCKGSKGSHHYRTEGGRWGILGLPTSSGTQITLTSSIITAVLQGILALWPFGHAAILQYLHGNKRTSHCGQIKAMATANNAEHDWCFVTRRRKGNGIVLLLQMGHK